MRKVSASTIASLFLDGSEADYRLRAPSSSIPPSTIHTKRYIHTEYRWQPSAIDCVYDVVEHIFRSRNRPVNYAYIITAGICEHNLDAFSGQRTSILSSFEEYQ